MKVRKRYIVGLICLVLLFVFFYKASQWMEERTDREVEATSVINDSGMVGWRDGKKQWQIKTDKITKSNGIVTFFDVHDGIIFREGTSNIIFETSRIEYNAKKNQLAFPNGLKLSADNKTYIIAEGLWDGEQKIFTGREIKFEQSNEIHMAAEKMLYEQETNRFHWNGQIQISRLGGDEGNIQLVADKLEYLPEQKLWKVMDNIVLKWAEIPSGQTYEIHTGIAELDDSLTQITMPGSIVFYGNGINGNGAGAVGSLSNMIVTKASIEDTSNLAVMTADRVELLPNLCQFQGNVTFTNAKGCSLQASEAEVSNEQGCIFNHANGKYDEKTEFSAERLEIKNDSILANGSVGMKKRNMVLSADQCSLNDNSKVYDLRGNIEFSPQKGIIIFSSNMNINEDAKKAEFYQVNIKQEDGTSICGERACYDDQSKMIIVDGNVITDNTDGRHIIADRVDYDVDRRTLEFIGHIKSNSDDSE